MLGAPTSARAPVRALRSLLALVIVAGALVRADAPASALQCGRWRWPVKTLSDQAAPDVDFVAADSSVQHLLRKDPPTDLEADTPRIRGVEFTTFRIPVELVGAAVMPDHDVHLIVQQPGNATKMMVVEFPYVRCDGAKDSIRRPAMKRARASLLNACGHIGTSFQKLTGQARITGVGFWDDPRTGERSAPNGIELHPVLRFNGTCAKR